MRFMNTDSVLAALVPIAADEIIVPFAALAVSCNAVELPSGATLDVLVLVKLVIAQLF